MTYANRTPVLGLNYGSDAGENFNWAKLDELVANAFQPGSPLQLPDPLPVPPPAPLSIANGQLVVGATVTQSQEDISVPTTVIPSGSEVEVARVDFSSTRLGPILVTGLISLSLSNTAASPAAAAFQMQSRIVGSALRIVHFFATVAAGSKQAIAIPVTAFVPAVTGAIPTFVSVSFIKTVGADATMILQAEDGRLTVVELA